MRRTCHPFLSTVPPRLYHEAWHANSYTQPRQRDDVPHQQTYWAHLCMTGHCGPTVKQPRHAEVTACIGRGSYFPHMFNLHPLLHWATSPPITAVTRQILVFAASKLVTAQSQSRHLYYDLGSVAISCTTAHYTSHHESCDHEAPLARASLTELLAPSAPINKL